MRTILLAGAAVVALGTLTTTANAGALWLGKHLLNDCLFITAIAGGPQGNCGFNVVGDGGKSNDDNVQKIKQSNDAKITWGHSAGKLLQLNGGLNVVEEGDGNEQKIKQSNYYEGPSPYHHTVQSNYAINYVEDGDDNVQEIEQSNSLVIGGGH